MTSDTPQKLEIDWLKTAGGAFAAVSSALLLSTLGAAGTIIGAALGSVIVTVGGALYTQGLARSHQRLAHVQTAALRKVGVAQAEVRRASRRQDDDDAVGAHLAYADERLDDVHEDLGAIADEPTGPGWRERLGTLPWKRVSLVAAGLFAAAVVAITAFELVAGESVSSITGGSDSGSGPTIGRISGGSGQDTPQNDEKVPTDGESTPSDAPASGPSDQPTPQDAPSTEPTPTPEPTAPAPTPTAPTAPETGLPDVAPTAPAS
jgi:hypothetical protein